MIKILHFITDTNIGGAGKLLCTQIKNMDARQFRIFVALPDNSKLINELKNLNCTLIKCKYSYDCSLSMKGILEDYEIIKKIRPHIVHSHASLSSRIAATLLSVPSRIFTRHCAFPIPKSMQSPVIRGTVGEINNILSTKIIAVADAAKQNLINMGCHEKQISTVINGVEPIALFSNNERKYLRAKLGIYEDSFVVTIIARLEEYKGHKTFLHAAKICLKYYPDFKFLIVGGGSQEDNLKELARKLKIEKSVQFLGFCNDVAPVLNITDINVNCSFGTETSSLALSEGMSLGIPCVASDYGGNPHMVKNGVNGLIFPRKNADALAQSLIRLRCDRNLYAKCSAGAYKRFREEFNASLMAKKMTTIYKNEYLANNKGAESFRFRSREFVLVGVQRYDRERSRG